MLSDFRSVEGAVATAVAASSLSGSGPGAGLVPESLVAHFVAPPAPVIAAVVALRLRLRRPDVDRHPVDNVVLAEEGLSHPVK